MCFFNRKQKQEVKESFNILCEQLKSRDCKQRKAALEGIVCHRLFKRNMHLLAGALHDGQEIVVRFALGIIKERNI